MSTMATPVAAAASATAATPAPKKTTWLSNAGRVLRTILHIGEAAAVIAAPVVKVAVPEIAPLYTGALGLAITSEALVGSESGTGVQKMAAATPGLLKLGKDFAQTNGLHWDDADITKWASALVDTLNLVPAPKS